MHMKDGLMVSVKTENSDFYAHYSDNRLMRTPSLSIFDALKYFMTGIILTISTEMSQTLGSICKETA